jgi:hypothetical protein
MGDKYSMEHFISSCVLKMSVPTAPCLEAAGMLMRDSATSAMRGWEQQKPDGFASELFLDQLILLES